MGREISRPEFPAETRRETLSRPVSSRNFENGKSLVLSRMKILENLKVLTCLDAIFHPYLVLNSVSSCPENVSSCLVSTKCCPDPSDKICRINDITF